VWDCVGVGWDRWAVGLNGCTDLFNFFHCDFDNEKDGVISACRLYCTYVTHS
jgi:hypothetical protein